ncbi:MAG TPA: Zn-ribbon domain-containing OB-fold protein [Ktedonobacteraceae bacterium]|nr:Zn-ribbon domain-containing OB-fold protein [Ktedonobacteraceae bacterium]
MSEGVRPKPLPVVTEVNRPFWEGCRSGILRLQYCDQCQQHQFYPRLYCMHCGSDKLTWVTATGRGVIYSYTIIHQNKSPEFVQDTPYNVAIIQLAEGPRMMSNVVGISPQDLRIDLPVKIVLDPVTDTISIPRFAPLA